MNAKLLNKVSTLSMLGNLGAIDEPTLIRDLTDAHLMIRARKGKQKESTGGVKVSDLRANLEAASMALSAEITAGKVSTETLTTWQDHYSTLQSRAEAQEGLEYHYLEQFVEAARGFLLTRGKRVSCKGDGSVKVSLV